MADLHDPEAPGPRPGDRLGAWRLLRALGEGGMGRVFLAERVDGHYQQLAAVKLLHGWGDGADPWAALTRERQILASLDHPHIARLIDGGSTPDGQPYLVMAHVDGVPIDAWVRDRRPDIDTVLALVGQVCDAVAHAHRHGVVHRDIKPANMLVDAEGRVHLLDFGIAHLLGSGQAAPAAMTPGYGSPEQRFGITPKFQTDVYSLGRVLGDLLEALVPPPPRAREWRAIVARATAPDPGQRYARVEDLQADLQRYRHHRPVRALPRTVRYRLAKALRRHWAGALAAGAVLVLAVGFTWQLVLQRDRALRAEAQARAVSDLLVGLFEGADPAQAGRPDITAASLVDQGRQRLAIDLQGQPALQASMQTVLARVYERMGRHADAAVLWQQVADGQREQGDADAEARALRRLTAVLVDSQRYSESVAPAERVLALRRAAGADPLALADAQDGLSLALGSVGRFDEAQAALDEALATRQRLQGPVHADLANTLHLQGLLARRRGALELAETRLREALAMKRSVHGPRHPATLTSQQLLGTTLGDLHRTAEAEALLRDLIVQRQAVLGPVNLPVATAHNELANLLQDAGRTAEAVALYREALRLNLEVSGERSLAVAVGLNNLASALEDLGDPAAEAPFRQSLALREALAGPDGLQTARARHNLARWLLGVGRAAEAAPLAAAAARVRDAQLPPGHDERLASRILLAELALARQAPGEAEAALAPLGDGSSLRPLRRAALAQARARLLAASGRPAEAARLRRDTLAALAPRLPAAAPALQRLRAGLVLDLRALGQAEAARTEAAALAPWLAAQHADSPWRRRLGPSPG